MKEFKKGDILVGIVDDEKYIFTYDCIVNIKIQSQFVKSSIVAKNIINSMGDICSPFLFQIDSVKKADDNTVLAYKNALDKYGKDIVLLKYRDGYGNIKEKKSVVFCNSTDFMVHLFDDYTPLISNIMDIEVIGNIIDNEDLIS